MTRPGPDPRIKGDALIPESDPLGSLGPHAFDDALAFQIDLDEPDPVREAATGETRVP